MAIKAEEIMMGNWVSIPNYFRNDEDRLMQVKGLSEDNTLELSDGKIRTIRQCKDVDAVVISEDILLKCGFERKGRLYQMEFFPFSIDFVNDDTYLDDAPIPDHYALHFNGATFSHPRMVYLHQLQNLYYSLTGTHLTFKP